MHPSLLKDHLVQSLYGLGLEVAECVLSQADGDCSVETLRGAIPSSVCGVLADFLPMPRAAKVYVARAAAKGLSLKFNWPEVTVQVVDGSEECTDNELDAYDVLSFAVRAYMSDILKQLTHRLAVLSRGTLQRDQLVRSYSTSVYTVSVYMLRTERFISPKWPLVTVEFLAQQIEHHDAVFFGVKVVVSSRKTGKVVIDAEKNRIYSSRHKVVTGSSVARQLLRDLNSELRLRRPSLVPLQAA